MAIKFKHVDRDHLKRMYGWLDSRDWMGYVLDMSQDFQTRYYTFSDSGEAEQFQRKWETK